MLYLPTFSCVSYGFHAGKHTSPMDPVGTAEPGEDWQVLFSCVVQNGHVPRR